jgi:tape measure domain-containing protein
MKQVTEGFRDALEIGRSQRQFETFTGSAEVAAGLMANIREFTAATPVTFGAAQQSVRTLLQYGVAQDEVIDRLKQLGDISGGSTEALQRLALAFGQITANTRLQGQELRQLIEAGFNPLAVISETTGETMMQLRQRMSDGALSAQEVADALQAATSEGGRFANALKNIGEETDFGVIQRLRSEFEKLRADFMIPITAIVGSGASEALENLDKFREEARKRMIFDPDKEVLPRDIVPELEMLDHVSGPAALGMKMYQKLIQTIIDEQRRAIKASQAEVDIAMKDIMSSADEQEMSNYEVEDSIHSKISAIRKEAEELRIGADEALIADLRRQGATEDYILALRKEMEELKKLQAEQKRLEEAEKQRHQEAMRRQREREAAAKKAENDRLRRIENERREAETLAKTVMTPLQVLEQEMSDIQRLAEFLTVDERVKLMEQARERFEKSIKDKESNAMATAALRGSTEEFRMIAEINKSQIDKEQKMHNEAQHERKTTNNKLDLQIKGLSLLPLKLGEELQDLMSTPVK